MTQLTEELIRALGAVQSFDVSDGNVEFLCAEGRLQISVLSEDAFRVRAKPRTDAFDEPFSYAVADTSWNPPPVQVEESGGQIVVLAGGAACHVSRADSRVHFVTGAGAVVGADDAHGMRWQGDAPYLSKDLPPDTAVYGLGQRAFGLNLRGRRYRLWNADPVLYDRGDDPVYFSIPFYIAVNASGQAYGLFFDNSYRGLVDVGSEGIDKIRFAFDGGELRYYFFTGPDTESILASYTGLTGRMPMPPLWALGYHQCRWSYFPESRVREIAREFRARQIPCDALYLDIDYMDGFRCFTWDRERFPDMAGMIDDLHADGFRVVAMIDPGIKVDPDYEVDRSGIEEDVFLKDSQGELIVRDVWPGPSHFPDFSSPRVRQWWKRQYDRLFSSLKLDGLWNDMNEPAIFVMDDDGFQVGTNTLPDDALHDWEGRGTTHVEAHNLYGMLMARATREALEALRPGRRQLVITRAPYAGAQRYASSWTGDNKSSWDHIRLSLSMSLNLGLSGMAFTGPDIGGFGPSDDKHSDNGNPTGEMVTRWLQAAVCLPFFRMHAMQGTPDQEPWSYGQPYEDINRQIIELRYRLLPYIYTTFASCARSGMPIVRPMFMMDGGAMYRDIDDQFMLGEHLLVAPVMEPGAVSREVVLPSGTWYDFWTGEKLGGGRTLSVDAPLDVLPLYVRAGAVLPLWPPMQHTDERPVEALQLRVYAGSGSSMVYEDDGDGPVREDGWSEINVSQTGGSLMVTWLRDPDTAPAYDRINVVVAGLDRVPDAVMADGQPVAFVALDAHAIQIQGVPVFEMLRID